MLKTSKINFVVYFNENPFDIRLKNLTTSKSKISNEKNSSHDEIIFENLVPIEETMCKQCSSV